jgi:hypothetical protein
MASHRRQRMPKAHKEIQDPTLQAAEPRSTPREDGKSEPRDVLSAVSDSEFEAEVDRFLDSLR